MMKGFFVFNVVLFELHSSLNIYDKNINFQEEFGMLLLWAY